MKTEMVTGPSTDPANQDLLRLVVSRGEEGVQLELLGPKQLAAARLPALPAPDRLHPQLHGAYFVG